MASSLWALIAAAGKPLLLARTLRFLAACEKPSSYRGAIVVENGPRMGIAAVVSGFPREVGLHYLYVPEANKSHALNCALSRLDGGLIFMTDDDVRLDPQLLVAYASAAADTEQGAFYGGPVLVDAEHGMPPNWLQRFYPLTIVKPWPSDELQRDENKRADQTFMGTNWAAFAADLQAIGGFDTRLGPGAATHAAGQETEAQRRLLGRGVQPVYVPGAKAWHYLHPEFLDPAWVLRRAYRHGLEWGIRRTRGGRTTLPMLRGALGRLNAHLKGAILRVSGGEERRFVADFHEAKWRGRWEGLLLGRRWNEIPQLLPPAADTSLTRAA